MTDNPTRWFIERRPTPGNTVHWIVRSEKGKDQYRFRSQKKARQWIENRIKAELQYDRRLFP